MAEGTAKKEVAKPKKRGFFKRLKDEFRKVIWTDRKTLAKQTLAVVVISVVMCIIISLVDGVALQLMQLIMR